MTSKVFRWVMVCLYAGLIFLGSSMKMQTHEPTGGAGLGSFYVNYKDYVNSFAHFMEYGVLCALLCWALSPRLKGGQILKIVFMAIIFTSLYAATDEVHQSFVPTRMAGVIDWLIDTIGAAVAGLCWLKIFSASKKPANV